MGIKRLASDVIATGLLLGVFGIAHNVRADSSSLHRDSEHEGRFQMGLWADMPYAKNGDDLKVAALIDDMNSAELAFTVFGGDTKDGSSLCTDAAISTMPAALFNQVRVPTVYVPGDNEWTDCHRKNNGGYNALERLSNLRQTMFVAERSFGQHTMELEHQGSLGGAYSENTRWTVNGVVFIGLNVPGSNNNKVNAADCLSAKSVRTQIECDADNAEYADRNTHNLAWIKASFERAKQSGAAGVMLVIQADPGFDWPETEIVNERVTLAGFDGYTDLLNTLVAETQAFDGQVVLVHGDTHFFKIDKPLLSASNLLKNFTRVGNFGSPNLHWIKVMIDARSRNVFTFEPMLVPGN
jgi:hypothetical protein